VGNLPGEASSATPYPTNPIVLVVDGAPGGLTDLLARISADGVARILKTPVVIENKAGASGRLAMDFVARSPSDGYTLYFGSNGNLFSRPFVEKGSARFDPVGDLQGVFGAGEAPQLLVVPAGLPVKSLAEFIAYAKAHPGRTFYGSAGVGSSPHISMSALAFLGGFEAEHVPYKGMGPAMTDLVAGQLQAIIASAGTVLPYVKAGKLKALAVASKKRLSSLPDVPTSVEAGVPGWQMSTWFGVFAPKRTSPEILRMLNESFASTFEDAAVRQKLVDLGVEPMGATLQSFAERVRVDYAAFAKVIKESKVKLE